MKVELIKFLLTGLIIYIIIIFAFSRYTGFNSVKTISIVQSITMTFGATGFIYSYFKFVKSKNEKFVSVAEKFPKKWNTILYMLNQDNSISPQIKNWILKGDVKEAAFRNLSLTDLNIIESIITTFYEVWLNMLSINLVTINSSVKDYISIFENKGNSETMTKHLNSFIGVLFKEEFVLNHIIEEKKFYPKGFINYIIYCVRSLK